jgi:hypothetical protein
LYHSSKPVRFNKPDNPASISVSARTFLFLFLMVVSVSVGFCSPSPCVAFSPSGRLEQFLFCTFCCVSILIMLVSISTAELVRELAALAVVQCGRGAPQHKRRTGDSARRGPRRGALAARQRGGKQGCEYKKTPHH